MSDRADDGAAGGAARHRTAYRLEVTAGPQRGASAPLDPDASPTLGSSASADICLSDARVPDVALAFERGPDGAPAVRARAGRLLRDGVPLEGDEPHPHVDGARYAIGATGFVLIADEAVPGARPAPGTDRAGVPGASGARAATGGAPPLPRAAFAIGVAALLCVGVGAAWLLHRPDPAPAPPVAAAPSPALAERLAAGGFDDVALVTGADGARRLEGYVASRERLRELARLARAEPPPAPDVRAHVQPEIVDGVRDVYRTNGLRASVESDGPGAVRVRTNEPGPYDPERLRLAAMQDVPGLRSLDDVNVPPPAPPAAEPAPRAVDESPGKRVVAVVGGDPSYVVTADDSRYFVGSALPSGHVITGIENETVMLEFSGRTTELTF